MEDSTRKNGSGGGKRSLPGLIRDDRPMPHDLDAEKGVIAAMLLEPDECIDIAIEKLGSGAGEFYHHAHEKIFQSIRKLYDEKSIGVDLITVANDLRRQNILEEVGGETYLAEIETCIATTANVETWCQIVSDYALTRKMISACYSALDLCYEAKDDIPDILNSAEAGILKVRDENLESDIVSISDITGQTFQYFNDLYHQKIEPGIPTGLPDLNEMIGGFKRGEMFVLAARPSIGKTSLGLNFMCHVALKENRAVAMFSLEMTVDQIARRLICGEADISEKEIYKKTVKPVELTRLTQAANTFKNSKIFVDATPSLAIGQLRAKARRLKARHNIELIVIDYLQLMKADKGIDSRQQEVAEISNGIKALAKELDLPVIVLAQLNREVEKSSGQSSTPKLSHLRESGAIEQDADIVVFLHRERDKQKDLDSEAQRMGIEARLIVEKNRNGETGIVDMLFFPKRMKFTCKHRYGEGDLPEQGRQHTPPVAPQPSA